MPPVRQDSLDEKKTEHDRVVGQMGGGGIRFTKAADLRCLAFVFARSASFVPRRIFCVSNAKLQPSFEEITPVRSIVFLLQSGPLFFYLFLLSPASYGKRLQPDPHETILALHSVRLLHERGCSPSYKRGQSFETADSITACANNNQNSLGPLYFSFQEKNKNSKFRISVFFKR